MLCFRRRIQINARRSPKGGEVRAVLEDDFHHFRVALIHHNGIVEKISAEAPRHPFSACPEASAALAGLVGMVLNPIANSVSRHTDASLQCTHMFDLAGLAIALAARGHDYRGYEIEVPRYKNGETQARLARDDGLQLKWDIHNSCILSPAPYTGVNIREGMARWALSTLPADESEAALVLRRCAIISLGRNKDIDQEVHARPSGRCYAQQPERAQQAIRIVGSTWDFSERRWALCQDDSEWLQRFSG
ncbi:MAG: hypothetical protein C0607_11165 [Azoarcus sp.]|nr:MAG: hypothetical protein C0607_11165 [Azoarcus sp.]TVT55106.1 MAG: DUF2889 domain-containing protein [Azoarcus sp. PHD]